jgi:hypothetical protein
VAAVFEYVLGIRDGVETARKKPHFWRRRKNGPPPRKLRHPPGRNATLAEKLESLGIGRYLPVGKVGNLANGGNARDRRRMRRIVQSVLETYGYARRRVDRSAEKRQSFFDFVFKYVVAAVAFGGLGYDVREFSPVLASALYLLALAVFFRGFWAWCNAGSKTVALYIAVGTAALLSFSWFDYNWIREEWIPTFLYLVPTRELIDCERRAFFVNHSGLKRLENVRVIIKDNKSGPSKRSTTIRMELSPAHRIRTLPATFG